MSLLTIAQAAARGRVAVPATIVGNSDLTAVRLLQAAQDAGRFLFRRHAWSVLVREHAFTTVNGTEAYALPSDYYAFIDNTAWDRESFFRMRGSMSPQDWQRVKSGLAASVGLRKLFRVKLDDSVSPPVRKIFIDPEPTAAEDLVIEYVSNSWCQSSGGTGQSAWKADDDTGRLDEYLLELETKWRFYKSSGWAYFEELNETEYERDVAIAADVPRETIWINDAFEDDAMLAANLPDTGIGL